MIKTLDEGIYKLLGVKSKATNREKWKNIAEILLVQLELIDSRTSISNAPAILTKHLHHQLNSKRALAKLGLITPAKAKETKSTQENQKTQQIKDLYLCPDCFGTSFWNPDGKGKRAGCSHPRLEEARQRAKENGEL